MKTKITVIDETVEDPCYTAKNLEVGDFFVLSSGKNLYICVDNSVEIQYLKIGEKNEILYFKDQSQQVFLPKEVTVGYKMED